MADSLESAFATYLEMIKAAAPPSRHAALQGTKLRLLQSDKQRMNAEVERLEQTTEFKSLVGAADQEVSKADFGKKLSGFSAFLLRTFLRLSGTYGEHLPSELFAIAEGEHLTLARRFRQEVTAAKQKSIYLAPIELVSFERDVMNFKSFEIRRFTETELDDILKQRVCRLFYPWATVDTSELASYWFLVCEDESETSLGWSVDLSGKVEVGYSPFSGALKQDFRRLILYPWKDQFTGSVQLPTTKLKSLHPWAGPFQFSIPFVLASSDSWIVTPGRAPDLSSLVTEPWFDHEGNEGGTRPVVACWLSEEETAEFCSFVSQIDRTIEKATIGCPEWRFADTALNFLEKAFVSRDAEQLLWHITTIEAILGEKVDSGLTKILKARTGRVLGGTTEERKQIGKNFEELYGLRSDLVHGNATLSDRDIYLRHLGQAREMARQITVWMLHYLASIREAMKDGDRLPSRDNLLSVLDMDEPSRQEISALLAIVPKDFPNPPEW